MIHHRLPYAGLVACGVLIIVVLAASSHAGENLGARAVLSFRSDSLVTTPPTPTPTILKTYVWIEGLTSIKGAQYTVRWHVQGDDRGLTVLGEKHPSGAECGEYLMRGHSIGIPTENTPNSWGTAFASDEADTTCTRGPLSEILFDASALGGRAAVIELCSVGLLDASGEEDHVVVQGDLRVNAGTTLLGAPCSAPILRLVSPRASASAGGATAIITGEFLTGVHEVRVGGAPATDVAVLDDTRLSFRMPAHALGVCDVQASTADGRSGWLLQGAVYSDAPLPAIATILPDTVLIGTPVTIQGSGFVDRMNVRIGGMLSPKVHVISSTLLTAVVPMRRVGTAGIRLELPDGQVLDWPGVIHLVASGP
jgi:hypothetical protein